MKPLARQSIFDIAVQECGSAEAAFDIAVLNDINLSDDLDTSIDLVMPAVVNQKVETYFKTNTIRPATAITLADNIVLEGIDYWAVARTFVVS